MFRAWNIRRGGTFLYIYIYIYIYINKTKLNKKQIKNQIKI